MNSSSVNFRQLSIDEISSENLCELYSVEEGWFFEFKEKTPDTSKIAKSIAAFANSLGGKLILGAKENQKSRTLDSLPGFTKEQAKNIPELIREAVRHHIKPKPYYECRCIETQDDNNNLSGTWVVIVDIPKGKSAPYIHSSGVIYQRIGDSSSPSPANDPHTIKQLIDENKDRVKDIPKRIEDSFAGKHKNIPRCEIVVKVRKEGREQPKKPITFSAFKQIAKKTSPTSGDDSNLFDNFYPMGDSFVARRTEGSLIGTGVTWEYDRQNGIHLFSTPLSTLRAEGGLILDDPVIGNESFRKFKSIFESKNDAKDVSLVIDLLPLYYFLASIFQKIGNISTLEGDSPTFLANARISNARNCVPFIGTHDFIEQLSTDGIPHIFRNATFIRRIDDFEDWIELNKSDPNPTEFDFDFSSAGVMLSLIGSTIGITMQSSIGITEDFEVSGHSEFHKLVSELFSKNFRISSHENLNQ